MLVLAAVVVRRQVRFPPHAVTQRQSRRDLPSVVRIQRIVKLAGIETVVRALGKGHGTTQQKVAQDQSRPRSVECRCTHGIDAGPVVQALLIDGPPIPN